MNKIYKCNKCQNVVESLNNINNTPSCCGENMTLLEEKTKESNLEKHVPFIEKVSENKVLIKIGEKEEHPMLDNHYIEFIEVLLNDGTIIRKNLNPGDKPQAEFNVSINDINKVREYCNLHGLWKN
jgi:superoxide reductase